MARKSDKPTTTTDIALIKSILNQGASREGAYQLGDHAEHTWGIPIPSLAMQWLIGGSAVFPCQRVLSVSGLPKSLKSTTIIEFLRWVVVAKGIGLYNDNEGKTSASMLDAMTWHDLDEEQQSRLLINETRSVEEWMQFATNSLKLARNFGYGPKGKRVPTFLVIDSLTGKATESEIEAMEKEGSAAGRAFPIRAAAIAKFLEGYDLSNTLLSFGYVRHMKPSIDGGMPGMPAQNRESGGQAGNFKASLSLRVTKGAGLSAASHPSMPFKDVPVEGYTLYMESNMSCLGPDHRRMAVDILWQYVPREDGTTKQLMKYDWGGALGTLLWGFKYSEKDAQRLYEYDKDRLDKALLFTQGKSKRVNCAALGLADVSLSEFGNAIEANPEMRMAVSKFLNIQQYRDVQEVDLAEIKG
jgi:hypothetical protein